jgi:hypothetical protein
MTITSVSEFLSAAGEAKSKLGLAHAPTTPWYLGQPDLKGDLVPAFFKSGIAPELEREVLRDFRLMAAEYVPVAGTADWQLLVAAHMNGLPGRILEWSANPLVALFLAVESLGADVGRVWVLNPWTMNELTAGLAFVPPVESDYFKKYVLKIDDPNASPLPEAAQPMAFRPTRTVRTYNTQNIYWTIHGKTAVPLNELASFLKRSDVFLSTIQVAPGSKKAIMKQLHDIGITRANLFPGAGSLAKTLAYRYSKHYIG